MREAVPDAIVPSELREPSGVPLSENLLEALDHEIDKVTVDLCVLPSFATLLGVPPLDVGIGKRSTRIVGFAHDGVSPQIPKRISWDFSVAGGPRRCGGDSDPVPR